MSTHSTESLSRWGKIKHGFIHEGKKFLVATAYLGVWFYAIGLYGHTQLLHYGISEADAVFSISVALIKAAIVAKFLITVEMLLPIKVQEGKAILGALLGHTVIYVVLVMILHANALGLEGYLLHGKTFMEGFKELGHAQPKNLIMIAIIYGLIILHYLTYFTLEKVIGVEQLRKIFLGR